MRSSIRCQFSQLLRKDASPWVAAVLGEMATIAPMTGDTGAPITVQASGKDLVAGGDVGAVRIEISGSGVSLVGAGGAPIVANFRDVTTIAVDQGRLLLVFGDGTTRYLMDGLGDRLGLVVSELREGRARQTLHDRFIEVPNQERIELAEYRAGDEHGVAQIAYHEWGVALLPVDERHAPRLVRRAEIAKVTADGTLGAVAIQMRPRPGAAANESIELLALGAQFEHHRARLAALRDGALQDAATLVARLLPDAPFAVRQAASAALVDGRPVAQSELGDAWPYVERAVLVDPTFAASYHSLVARGTLNGDAAPSWIALAPKLRTVPGAPTDADSGGSDCMSWFLVGLPGNVVAFELVSTGAHATYLFRVVPRAQYSGETAADALTQAVYDVSECLIDTRFLREPMYLTESALLDPRFTRYRFAIAALPTLRAARWRFVGRLIHRDDATWSAGLEDAIRFNSSSRDDAAVWPGGAPTDAGDEDGPTMESS